METIKVTETGMNNQTIANNYLTGATETGFLELSEGDIAWKGTISTYKNKNKKFISYRNGKGETPITHEVEDWKYNTMKKLIEKADRYNADKMLEII